MRNVRKLPTMGRPPGRTREETLAEILLAARKCFGEKGYGSTSLKDIGAEIGISHAALYKYFPNKAELYLATLADAQQSLLPLCAEAVNQEQGFREKLKAVLRVCATSYANEPHITAFLGSVPVELQRYPELQPAMAQTSEIMSLVVSFIGEAKQAGELNCQHSAEEFFITFMGAAMGIGVVNFGLGNASMEPAADIFISLLDGSLFN